MEKKRSSKLAVLQTLGIRKTLLHATLASVIVIAGSLVRTSKVEAQTQYCQAGNVFIPSNKICATTIGTTVNGISIPILLDATAYYAEIDQVQYSLLNPLLVTIPGLDGDRVTLNTVSVFLDPVLEFDASFQDFGEPSPFNLTFTSVPFSPRVVVTSSLSGTLTDQSTPQNGVSLTTMKLLTYDFLDATDTVVNSFNFGSSVSFPAGTPNSHLYEPLSGNHLLACNTDGCGTVRLSLAFTGSGGGDRYDFISRSEITVPAPEPFTILGSATALGFGALFKRKLSKKG